jgi:nucleoside-diphosphate-sugar epimerase
MSILIIGGGGMVGQKLAKDLVAHPLVGMENTSITLFDIAFPNSQPDVTHNAPPAVAVAGIAQVTGTLTDADTVTRLAGLRPQVIFHLASIVSGEAEADFDLGWQTNMLSFWTFLEALRAEHMASGGTYVPRVVFTSSIAVFGSPFDDKITDTFLSAPLTSYGAQKACNELLLGDFSRKGFVDGLSIRLPTICVRPGKANMAASSFFSGIIREPLNGLTAVLPVADTVRHWHASPRAAVGFLRRAAELDTARLTNRRALSMPGLSCTVAEQIDALRQIAGQKAVDLIHYRRDDTVAAIVAGWPQDFAPQRAIELGFVAETDFAQIIQTYIDDDLSHG